MNCARAHPRLSDYVDNTLTARETWELEKHLGECHACTRALNELRRTVDALHAAPRREVSADFMERLQARIAGMEPEPPRRAWRAGLREAFRPRVLPLWGAATATAALVLVMAMPRTPPNVAPPAGPGRPDAALVQAARDHNVALAASDPLADLAAANLAASSPAENSVESETAP